MNEDTLLRFYRSASSELEHCFYVETSDPLTGEELEILSWLLAGTIPTLCLDSESTLMSTKGDIVEVGPRLSFATASSTNAVSICHACGLTKVTRLECSRRHLLPSKTDVDSFLANNHDRMTECRYPEPLQTFATGTQPQPVRIIPLMEEGVDALRRVNQEMGLGMDDWDLEFYHDLFVKILGRNPTDVECFQLGQANSEHSRHWFFKGRLYRNGQLLPHTLMQIVQAPLRAIPSRDDVSVVAFDDNASAIQGFTIQTLMPTSPGESSPFGVRVCHYDLTLTVETHNHPSRWAPFPGAETGTGGRIRDGLAIGRGGLIGAGTAGYCTGSLYLPDYHIPGEDPSFLYPDGPPSPLTVLIEMSDGASDYGNKLGEPVTLGYTRTFGLRLPDGERREWVKPIMLTGGIGQMNSCHVKKEEPKTGMIIVHIGGPAYRIGLGGGSASSMLSGTNAAELDFDSVQRGDAEMENKMGRVVRACVEMGERNPILSIHDQGAGGLSNVITELSYPAGGEVNIREVKLGDITLSVLEIWSAEYQECNALLIRWDRLHELIAICERERVNCEVLGKITGDGRIRVSDTQDDSCPVDLPLHRILGEMPQKEFHIDPVPSKLVPLDIPVDLTVTDAIKNIFCLPSVGSKGFLTRKVDRSVGGRVVRQQGCGPLQLPVADVSVVAQSHLGLSGAATAIGEQPIKMLVDPAAGARMAVAEALFNLSFARTNGKVRCSANWMWAAKLAGEGSKLYDAACAMSDLMIHVGIAVDGGKDSLSMAAMVGDETVKAPGELVISAYAAMSDITKVVTPDIKRPGESVLLLLDLSQGKRRLGGSALAQTLGQIGDESPDVDDPTLLKNAFRAIQDLIWKDWILAGHDISDGGLITTVAEMVMAGNCGVYLASPRDGSLWEELFAEELGIVVECRTDEVEDVEHLLNEYWIPTRRLGSTLVDQRVMISHRREVLDLSTSTLLRWWEATSDQLEQHQMNPKLARQQASQHVRQGPTYKLSFEPRETSPGLLGHGSKHRVAIVREEGSNGDREMASAFYLAGFEPWDVTMTDLLERRITLEDFRGVAFVGGFSYADVLDSARGWAGNIQFNPIVAEQFEQFRQRPDTFSLGVCNGCQLMTLLGWVPEVTGGNDQLCFVRNDSERFESRWATVRIKNSPAIMLKGMAGSVLGVWVAHGEGRLYSPRPEVLETVVDMGLAPIVYVDDNGEATEQYPFNPNSSPHGITALCSPDGRHLAMMPHPERAFLAWQWPWMPRGWRSKLQASPWLQLFQNARLWCDQG